MTASSRTDWLRHIGIVFGLVLTLTMALPVSAAPDKVTAYQDAKGWKILVNGESFYIKGMVWGYMPPGENYTYSLWNQPKPFIKKVIDREFAMLKAANVNAIRSFSNVPPEWVTYGYEKFGIMTVINPLMGRYGATINGAWVPLTDYSDPTTRDVLKTEFLDAVRKYKDVPGILMFALGNENNYGLSWSASFEIEDLPEGEKNTEKAKFLYSLYGETIHEAKQIDSDHLYTIVNGDIQYIDLIKKYVHNLDVLGSNVYRGISFTSLWDEVAEKLNKPVVFMEFGSDAFNAKEFREDQLNQALYLKGQWQEMYNKSYGNGEAGNSVGGFVFQWRDEWWKYKQTEDLELHNTHASWSNGGYSYDLVDGQNNMNEEWFGICSIGDVDDDGIYATVPRMAYDVLSAIWSIDQYATGKSEINDTIDNMDMELYELKSSIRGLQNAGNSKDKFRFEGGNFQAEMMVQGDEQSIDEDGEDGLSFQNGEMLFLDFAFEPSKRLRGDFTLNILNNVAVSDFEFRYGDRGAAIPVRSTVVNSTGFDGERDIDLEGTERIEIYDFEATYEADNFTLNTFYHVPRYHWGNEGDFFGLMKEATDMEGMDRWNSKPPFGFEFVGKGDTEGLKIAIGPEIYWGANPKMILKYRFGAGDKYTFMHSEDIARRESTSSATEATSRQSRQTTLSMETDFYGAELKLGGIISGTEHIGEDYDRLVGSDVVVDEIEFKDTLGIKSRLTFNVFDITKAYIALGYQGLVADGGDFHTDIERGTQLPQTGDGNKKEIEIGAMFQLGNVLIYPRALYRDNLVGANPLIEPVITGANLSPGIAPRDADSDPFAVGGNRKARSAELFVTYDPTGGTFFYDWDNDTREDAGFAFNIGITYTDYLSATDASLFFFEPAGTNASFGLGQPPDDVKVITSKMVFNPSRSLKAIIRLAAGIDQPSGVAVGTAIGDTGLFNEPVEYRKIDAKFIINKKHIIEAYFKKDAWGYLDAPEDFQRQFNISFPEQYMFDYAYLLDELAHEKNSSKIGFRILARTLDERSLDENFVRFKNDFMFEARAYLRLNF